MNLVAAAKSHSYRIICGSKKDRDSTAGVLSFSINGKQKAISLNIKQLSHRLIENLPDVSADLVEIASYVYATDAAISRGGPVDSRMGELWRRNFSFEIPVRCLELWNRHDIKHKLEETLSLLSDDFYEFTFISQDAEENIDQFFDFGKESSWQPDSVVMFSGGLDSFAGAVEELIERDNRVALISHHSSTKIGKVQTDLARELVRRVGDGKLQHIPITAQLKSGSNNDGTHRTRSFLFASLGMATAQLFGKAQVSFYENGVISLNLPPVAQVIGARATRTTHPRTLNSFSKLFSVCAAVQN